MNDFGKELQSVADQQSELQQYLTPEVRVMSEAEVLTAFQVTAASPTSTWWAC